MLLQLALSWSFCAVILAPLWGTRSAARGGHAKLSLAAALAPLLLGLACLWWVPVAPEDNGLARLLLLGAMALCALQSLIFMYWHPRGAQRLRHALWLACGLMTQLVFAGLVERLCAAFYAHKYAPFHIRSPLGIVQLQTMLLLAVLTSGLLLAAAFGGVVEGLQSEDVLIHEDIDSSGFAERDVDWIERSRSLAQWLVLALVARGGAVAFSLALGTLSSPAGPGQYLQVSLAPSSSLILVRFLIGIMLPLLYALLAMAALRGQNPRQADRHFIPAFMMIVLTEIFGAALTAGNWGVAY